MLFFVLVASVIALMIAVVFRGFNRTRGARNDSGSSGDSSWVFANYSGSDSGSGTDGCDSGASDGGGGADCGGGDGGGGGGD